MVLEEFCDGLLIQGLEKITIDGYKRVLSKFIKEMNTEKPKQKQAENYLLEIRKKNYSYSHIKNTSLAVERYQKFINRPITFIRPRKPQTLPTIEILTEGEIARMLAACKNSREMAAIALLAYCGLRNKEVCQLRTRNIDLDNNLIQIIGGKFKKDRVVPISKEGSKIIIQYLREYPRNSPVFTTLQGNRKYNGWALRKLVKKVGRNAGIKKRVYPHLLRHGFCSHLLERGANIIAVQQFMGHSNIQTTMRYTHFSSKKLQQEYHYYIPSYQ